MLRFAFHFVGVLALTLLTQVGGLAWLFALFFRYRIIAFVLAYVVLCTAALWAAPSFGRVPLNCFASGPLQVQSWIYCVLNRNYVATELKDVLVKTSKKMDKQFPGTTTLVLDANFPFLNGFPLLPHLSHDDGKKVDLAFYYRDGIDYLPGATRSPVGYFAFESGPTNCQRKWPTLRWDLNYLQPLWRNYALDEVRTSAAIKIFTADTRVGKVLIEPHLVKKLNLTDPKIRFQGCRAARHDDHIHLQLE